ncbi:hypothetical protein [Cellulomonas sp. URHD0024]|uniref:hypothetical protein n=1 Tax=Cellulomonas sp. URHD0024 TaxID=1302620 RepID=UPI00040FED44|nr:hypothetical protein [Cellulomonas sp. URHD0024]
MILVVLGLAVLLLGITAAVQGMRLVSRARAVPRVRVPALLLGRIPAPGGWVMTLEFPGPDNAPRRADVYAAVRTGLGATPTFGGYVYVNPNDLEDVKTRPQGKVGPGSWLAIGGIVLIVVGVAGIVAGSIIRGFESLGT